MDSELRWSKSTCALRCTVRCELTSVGSASLFARFLLILACSGGICVTLRGIELHGIETTSLAISVAFDHWLYEM